jgi:hypothetical protein
LIAAKNKILIYEGVAKLALEVKSEDFCAGSVSVQIDILTQVASQGVSDEVAILFRIFKAIFRHTWVK